LNPRFRPAKSKTMTDEIHPRHGRSRPVSSSAHPAERLEQCRLQLDFLKAESLLEQQQVAHTVVVIGGTRISEHQAPQRALASCANAVATSPNTKQLQRRLEIARSIAEKSHYYDIARKFGRIVGAAGEAAIGGRIMIMTGGGPGIMEAPTAARSTLERSRSVSTSRFRRNNILIPMWRQSSVSAFTTSPCGSC
jgi:hypothetical protein